MSSKTFIGNPATRHRAGDGHLRTKITDAQVQEIRRARLKPYRGQIKDLANQYGVTRHHIGSIMRGERRKVAPVEVPKLTPELRRIEAKRRYRGDPEYRAKVNARNLEDYAANRVSRLVQMRAAYRARKVAK